MAYDLNPIPTEELRNRLKLIKSGLSYEDVKLHEKKLGIQDNEH